MKKFIKSSVYDDVVKNAPDNERYWFDVNKDVDKYYYEIDGKCEKLQKVICDKLVELLLSDYYEKGYFVIYDAVSQLTTKYCYGYSEAKCKQLLDDLSSSKNEVYNWVGSMLYDQMSGYDDDEFEEYFNGLNYSKILSEAINGIAYAIPNYCITDEDLNDAFWSKSLTEEQNSQLIDEIEEYRTYLS